MTFEKLEEACRTNICEKCIYQEFCIEWEKIAHLSSYTTYKEKKVNFFIKFLRKKKLEKLLA